MITRSSRIGTVEAATAAAELLDEEDVVDDGGEPYVLPGEAERSGRLAG